MKSQNAMALAFIRPISRQKIKSLRKFSQEFYVLGLYLMAATPGIASKVYKRQHQAI